MINTRQGFTLIELITALAVGGIVLLAAHGILRSITHTAELIPSAAADTEGPSNALDLIRMILGNSESGGHRIAFKGNSDSATFASWCPAVGGWLTPCDIALRIVGNGDSMRLTLAWDQVAVNLTAPGTTGRIRYLLDAASGGIWLPEWQETGFTVPLAVEIHLGNERIFLRIGDRG